MTIETEPLAPRRRSRWKHALWRVARTVVLLYVVLMLTGCFFQEKLIFPGAGRSQGVPELMVQQAPPGAELLELRITQGQKIVALFGPALGPTGIPLTGPEKHPTILYFYGNGMCLADAAQWEFDQFRQLGANVCIVEYPGYGGSDGSPSEQGCYAAAEAAYMHLLTRPEVDPQQIIVGGWSLGGAVACDLASRQSVAGLFMFSSFSSMADVAGHHYPFLPVGLILRHHFRSVDKIGTVKAPILIMHGTSDGVVPFANAQRLKDKAPGQGLTFVPVEGADHNDFYLEGERQVLRELAKLLERLRPATGPSRP